MPRNGRDNIMDLETLMLAECAFTGNDATRGPTE
jgi:hypothetical protein